MRRRIEGDFEVYVHPAFLGHNSSCCVRGVLSRKVEDWKKDGAEEERLMSRSKDKMHFPPLAFSLSVLVFGMFVLG